MERYKKYLVAATAVNGQMKLPVDDQEADRILERGSLRYQRFVQLPQRFFSDVFSRIAYDLPFDEEASLVNLGKPVAVDQLEFPNAFEFRSHLIADDPSARAVQHCDQILRSQNLDAAAHGFPAHLKR